MSRGMKVICTLDTGLGMYTVPGHHRAKLKSSLPNVEIHYTSAIERCTEMLGDAEIYWGNTPTAEDVINMPRLRWIHLGCVGIDRILKIPMELRKEIIVTNSPGSATGGVVNHTLYQLMHFLRRGDNIMEMQCEKKFSRWHYDKAWPKIRSVDGLKVAIIGYGSIGSALGSALEVLGASVRQIAKNPGVRNGRIIESPEALFEVTSWSNCVISLLPKQEGCEGIYDKKFFRDLGKDGIFINNGRSNHVNEEDLLWYMKEYDCYIGLDTVNNHAKLLKAYKEEATRCNSLLLTPHIAAVDSAYWDQQLKCFMENIRLYTMNSLEGLKS